MSPYRLVTYQTGLRAFVACLAVTGIVLGLAMIAGGPERFGADGFAVARRLPGGVYTWGAAFAAAGGVAMAGIVAGWRRRVVMVGTGLEGCLFAFFALSLGIATYSDPKVAVTGPIIYTGCAALCAIAYDTGRGLRR